MSVGTPQQFGEHITVKNFLRFFLLACTLLASFSASALVPKVTTLQWWTNAQGPYPTPEAACAYRYSLTSGYEANLGPQHTGGNYTNGSTLNCQARYQGATSNIGQTNAIALPAACPANSTPSGSACQCNTNFDESGGQCVPHTNQCTVKVGTIKVTNWTLGFFRSPDENDYGVVGPVNKLPSGGKVCNGGCEMTIPDAGAPGWAAWRSQTPNAQGLYRGSLDVPMGFSGSECTAGAGDAPLDPVAAEPACPGAVGEVNGKKGCYGTAQAPVSTTPAERPPVPPVAGNPSAGPKPVSGEGSGTGSAGRTPSTGNGGNAGGPAGAAVGGPGGTGGGTRTGGGGATVGSTPGEEQASCGAPGQPVCAVKVDEAGVPVGGGTSFDSANAALDTNQTKVQEQIGQAAAIQAPAWSFSFQLPTGCTAYQVGQFGGLAFTMNPCQYQSTIHDLMSMLWAAVTAFCLIQMVGRTIRES